jgi:uncharacterized membrane protein
MAIAVLSLAGLFIALYLFAHHAGWTGPIVCGVGDCAKVQSSVYADFGPVPVSSVGVVGYLLLLGLSLEGIRPEKRDSRTIGLLLFGGSLVGVLFSGYLTYLEAAVIRAWCQYCVVSAILMTLIFLATLPELRRGDGGLS